MGPGLLLDSPEFKSYVLKVFDASEIRNRVQADQTRRLYWSNLRAPLGIAVTGFAMFLFATQKEMWQLVAGLAGSFAVATQTLSKFGGIFGKAQAPPTEDGGEQ